MPREDSSTYKKRNKDLTAKINAGNAQLEKCKRDMGNLVARCSTETAHQKIAERIREHYEALIVQPYGNQNAVEAPHSQLNSLFNLLRRHDPDFVCLPRNMMHFTSPETFFILPLSTKVAIANNWAPSCIRFFQNTGTVALNEAKALVSEIHASEAFETN